MMKGPCVERLNQSSLNQFHEMRVLVGQENEILTPTLQETKSKEGIKGILKKNTVKKAKTLKGSSMFSMFREINKIKLVKMAIKKFRKGLANSFFGKLLKIHFQIIGDPVNVQDGFDKFSAKKVFFNIFLVNQLLSVVYILEEMSVSELVASHRPEFEREIIMGSFDSFFNMFELGLCFYPNHIPTAIFSFCR